MATDKRKDAISLFCGPEAGRLSRRSRKGEAGWSLIELLIATALGMSLVTLALQAFLAGSGLQLEVNAELRLHEGARYAMHVLGDSAKLAGFPGCLGESESFTPLAPVWAGPVRFSGVEGWNGERPHPTLELPPDGDAVAFWWSVAGCGADAPEELAQPPADSGMEPERGLRGRLFFIGRRGNSPDNPPALFMRETSNFGDISPARELVEGLESMRILYQAENGGAYASAHQLQDWENVRAVRIELGMQSLLVADLRRNFSRTVTLRNRPIDLADFPAGGIDEEGAGEP